ncbi:aminopeptidase N-like isoform X2 [Homarus americanus]|uniref:aminopeptidase N-like isoform X2 n=1 Tax=Homarus americanus TaxID=6706 RepID=UPI001C465B56|nr:aminopeptidase N-like isoform X2 [Homarus americanus]
MFGLARFICVMGSAILASCTVTTTPAPITMPTVSEEGDKSIVLLPKTVRPLHYLVKLQPFINGNFSIHGHVKIDFHVLVSTHHLVLHMADIVTLNDTTKVIAKDSEREEKIVQQGYNSSRMLYIVHLQEQLSEGRNYTLSLDFVGTLGEQARGFYRSSYKKQNGERSWVASTQFQSTDARRAFPCFDEPGLKATFKIFLAREEHMNALSNMPLVSSTPIEGQEEWLWDEFQESVPMSTYLVAFAISDLPSKVVSDNGTLIRVVTRAATQDFAEYGGQTATKVLSYYKDYFSISFPLPKIDLISVPENSFAAMENWGLITFRETGLLYDPESSPASQKQYVCYLVSHELAHQWFGNLVTLSWWTDLWLNEGFATYMGDTAVDHIEPSWGMLDQFVVERQQKVMALDALRSSHPVRVPVSDPAEINEIFDVISYSKGASIIRMMNHFLTETVFRRGLKTYLTDLKYKNADQDDLWRHLTKAAREEGTLAEHLSVKTIMDTWTLQKGFPIVTVTRAGNSSAVITQEYFVYDKNATTSEYNWWIPVTYTSQEGPEFHDTNVRFWLNGKGIDPVSYIGFPQPHHWVIFNLKQTGYYRVNYDEANWELLTRQLQEDHTVIHITNRAQIIDDVLNLARAGKLSYKTALGVLSYLRKEKQFVPWKAAFNNFQYLYDMFYRDPAYGALKDYLLSIIVPMYDKLGFEEEPGEDQLAQKLRTDVITWACNLGHLDCRNKSLAIFRRWMADPESFKGVSVNVASAVYCTAIAEGGEPEWTFAWKQTQSNTVVDTSELVNALACTDQIWLLTRYLDGAFNANSRIRRQDAAGTFRNIAAGGVGNMLAWDYLRSHWANITEYIGSTFFALPKMVDDVTKTFNTLQLLHELEEFERVNKDQLLTASRAVSQAVEATKINLAWMEDNRDFIVDWLKEQGFSSNLSDL